MSEKITKNKRENFVGLRLGEEQLNKLINFANADDRSVSAIIRIAISEYITKKEAT